MPDYDNDYSRAVQHDHDALSEQSRRSGLSYNEAKEWIARTTGGRGTHVFSDTDIEEVKRQNQASKRNQSK